MRILFLTHEYPNYVPDLLMHGLRKLLGTDLVDYPRKDCVYEGILGLGVCPEGQKSHGWFPLDLGVDRNDIARKLEKGYFDYVVFDIRSMEMAHRLLEKARYRGLAIIEGEDRPVTLTPGAFLLFRRETDGLDYGIPLPMSMPEEIYRVISQFDTVEKKYSIGFVGSVNNEYLERREITDFLQQYVNDGFFRISGIASSDVPVPAGRLDKIEYYEAMQSCHMTLSIRGAGYDTFRFWEHAACNSIHVSQAMPLLIPDDFRQEKHLFRFPDIGCLKSIVDRVLGSKVDVKAIREENRQHLLKYHMTEHRAGYFLDHMNRVYG